MLHFEVCIGVQFLNDMITWRGYVCNKPYNSPALSKVYWFLFWILFLFELLPNSYQMANLTSHIWWMERSKIRTKINSSKYILIRVCSLPVTFQGELQFLDVCNFVFFCILNLTLILTLNLILTLILTLILILIILTLSLIQTLILTLKIVTPPKTWLICPS